jgi:hypothetical protein
MIRWRTKRLTHTYTLSERSSKAAEIFSRNIIVEIEAIRNVLNVARDAESQSWSATGDLQASHARNLADLQKVMKI